jgi:hypothetical protein
MFFFLRPRHLLQVLSIFLLQYGCTPIFYLTGDIKKPKYEDPVTVKSFVLNEEAKYNTLFVTKDEKNLDFFTNTIANHLPAILIFNKDQVNIFADRSCPWATIRHLDSLNDLKNDTAVMTDKKVTVQKLVAPLTPIAGTWPDEKTLSQYDYFIFYTWAKFVPKLSKKMINDVNKFAEMNSNRIFIGAINLDLQQSWVEKTAVLFND